jgi:uncharacterized protein (DUF2147 family)
MIHVRPIASMILAVALASAALAEPARHVVPTPVGLWRTYGDDGWTARGLVRITEQNGELGGTLVGSLVPGEDPDKVCRRCPGKRRDQPLKGLVFMTGLRWQGSAYGGGEILDPDSGALYKVTIRLEPDGRRLVVRAYRGISLLGRSQTWERVE